MPDKTDFVLAHKLRGALSAETAGHSLKGEAEIDVACFGSTVCPENCKRDHKDHRL